MSETPFSLEYIVARVADVASDKSGSTKANASLISSTLAVSTSHAIQGLSTGESAEKKVLLDFAAVTPPFIIIATVIADDYDFNFAVLRLESKVPWELPSSLLTSQVPPEGVAWECNYFISSGQSMAHAFGRVKGLAKPIGDMRPLLLSMTSGRDFPTGASGAPVVVEGQVVGIVQTINEQEDIWQAILFADMARSTVTAGVRDVLLELNEVDLLRRLSRPSRQALNYANALRTAMSRSKVHMEHLILGLFYEQDGPTRRLLLNKKIDEEKLRSLVASVTKSPIPAGAINPVLELTTIPPLSRHVRQALIAARTSVDELQSEGSIQSQHLLYGVLSISDCDVVKVLLDQGVQIAEITLEEPSRRDPNQPLIAEINNDLAKGTDRLNIRQDVLALCYVIAARDVEPPISIGLFGNWGSGKSFFMRMMREEIKQLQGDFYCSNIVQLEFNAWYYIDKDLWASLASEIFEKLAEKLSEEPGPDAERRRARLLAAAASSKDVLADAERKKREADAELQETEQRLARLRERKSDTDASLDENLRKILRTVYIVARDQPEIKKQVDNAAAALKADDPQGAMEVKGQLLELKKDFPGYLQATGLAIKQTRQNWVWLVALALVVLVLLIVVNPILAWVNASGLLKAASFVLTTFISLGVILGPFIERGRRALNIIDRTRQTYANEITIAQNADMQAIKNDQQQLQRKVTEAQQRVDEASKAAKDLNEQLDALRFDRQLSKFIKDRNASTDYTKHFGTVARARNDFERLADLLKKAKDQREKKTQGGIEEELDLPPIDRIILYIDDLDRCPEDKVFAVLQAVHLLLSFPLFVVVVGVDPRWLLHSLKRNVLAFDTDSMQGDVMQDEEERNWESTPLNYLDKIFQIPFTLRSMERSGFAALIESLTQPKVSAVASNGETGVPVSGLGPTAQVSSAGGSTRVDMSLDSTGTRLATETQPFDVSSEGTQAEVATPTGAPLQSQKASVQGSPVLNPRFLTIEEPERLFMKQLYPLIPSPRASKRFVNVYRLLRASVEPDWEHEFIGDATWGGHRPVLLLLAILSGYPNEATEILQALVKQEYDESWWEFVSGFEKRTKPTSPHNDNRYQFHMASPFTEAVSQSSDVSQAVPAPEVAGTAPQNNKEGQAGQESKAKLPTEERSSGTQLSRVTEGEARRWRELLDKLKKMELSGLVPADRSCQDFRDWAPKVARYSFQSGRVLLIPRQDQDNEGNRK